MTKPKSKATRARKPSAKPDTFCDDLIALAESMGDIVAADRECAALNAAIKAHSDHPQGIGPVARREVIGISRQLAAGHRRTADAYERSADILSRICESIRS